MMQRWVETATATEKSANTNIKIHGFLLNIYRGYYMAAQRYKICLQVLKNINE